MTRSSDQTVTRRSERVVIRQFGDETVVYDLVSERVTALDPVTTKVWAACEKPASVGAIAETAGLDADQVRECLAKLAEANLMKSEGLTRRNLLRGASVGAIAVPLVGIAAPAAWATSSRGNLDGSQTACSRKNGSAGSDITFIVNATLFDPNTTLAAYVSYKDKGNASTVTATQNLQTNGAGGTSYTFTFNVAKSIDVPSGAQTVTIHATQGGKTFSQTATIASC